MTSSPAIHAEGVRHTFGDIVALDGLDLEVQAGTVFGLLGPNGAGKTTLVRILSTLLRPTAGRATVLGRDVVAEPLAVRRRIGLAGQFAAVDEELTGRENVEMVGRLYRLCGSEARASAAEVLERFGLADAADRRVSTYSGGMRRRLDLGASLVGRPPVILLDEPTTGLDPRSRQELWSIVEELRGEGTTVLLTTQYLEEADPWHSRSPSSTTGASSPRAPPPSSRRPSVPRSSRCGSPIPPAPIAPRRRSPTSRPTSR
jgi:ABC-2 type transport system ATP-binding protein